MANPSSGDQNPASNRGAPQPPTFNHPEFHNANRLKHLDAWADKFETYCEASYRHNAPPTHRDPIPNQQWIRLLRLALAHQTQKAIWPRFADLKTSEVNYCDVISDMQEHFGNLQSKYLTLNQLLEATQQQGETFTGFLDHVHDAASRSGLPCGTCTDHLTRHQAIQGTSSQLIRASALQHKCTLSELLTKAVELEISPSAIGLGIVPRASKPTIMAVDTHAADPQFSPPIYRIAGPYSKSFRQAQTNRRSTGHQGTCQGCGSKPWHKRTLCPTLNETCKRCGKVGHFVSVCRSFRKPAGPQQHVRQLGPDFALELSNQSYKHVRVQRPHQRYAGSQRTRPCRGANQHWTSEHHGHFITTSRPKIQDLPTNPPRHKVPVPRIPHLRGKKCVT